MTEQNKIINLDWDNITNLIAMDRCNKIMQCDFVESITLYESSTQKGNHAIVKIFDNIYTDDIINLKLRRFWKDDAVRLVNDSMALNAHYRDVMFTRKTFKKFGVTMVMERTPLYLYSRIGDKIQCQKIQ